MGRVKLLFDDLVGRRLPAHDAPEAPADADAPPEAAAPTSPGSEQAASAEKPRGFLRRWWRRGALGLLAALSLAGALAGVWIAWPLPPDLARPAALPGLVIEDRHGLPLRVVRAPSGERGGWVSLADVDPAVPRAFLAAEDRRYFEHGGIDWRAVARASLANLRAGHVVSGASTLSMQTARVLRPLGRGLVGKAGQALWALRLEAHLDKRAILERYLNRVPLGQGTVGVAAASELYFGGPPRDLSLGQAALLAALARAPSLDNPLVSPARARAGRDQVLHRLGRYRYAPPDEIRRALAEPVTVRPPATPFLAPHFTTTLLARAEDAGFQPIGRIATTLDVELQSELEAEVRHAVGALGERGAGQAAAVVLENRTGDVLAWVGSPDFWQPGVGQVDMVASPRQPGSALKPFLYALAFDRGFTAATVLPDVPKTYGTTAGVYTPRNYDREFHGPVRVRDALGSSYNVPAVEMAHRLGVSALLRVLHNAGFASLTQSAEHYGLGLALGNGDVTLLELANAYRGLANGGVWRPVRFTQDAAAPLSPARAPARRFASQAASALVLDILADPTARVGGFGVETPFDLPFPVAGKTGTSRHFTDNWAVATTGGFTIAVWVGNSSGEPMHGVSGITGAGPLLYRSALRVATRYPTGALPTPAAAGLQRVAICRLSGLRAGGGCASTDEWFVPGTAPSASGDWRGPDGRVQWPVEFADWAAREPALAAAAAPPSPAGGGVPSGLPAAAPAGAAPFRIVSIEDGDRYAIPPGVPARYATLPLRAAGGGADRGVHWFVDGQAVAGPRWSLVPGRHTITARSDRGEEAEVGIVVER